MLVFLIYICFKTTCPSDTVNYSEAQQFLKEHTNTEYKFAYLAVEENNLDADFTSRDLSAYNRYYRSRFNIPNDESIITAFFFTKSPLYGLSEPYIDSNSIFINAAKSHDQTRTLVHELLHLQGYGHVNENDNIMHPTNACSNIPSILDCKLYKNVRL